MHNSFGTALKDWRARRRMSQLDLGLHANVSARHISFLETGRARPSQAMVMHLCETLELPRVDRNTLLGSAGFAPVYQRRDLSDVDMAPVRTAVEWMLERHDPFPAFALDRHWTIVKANRSATALMTGIGIGEGDSLLDALLDAGLMAQVLENWHEVMQHLVVRLRTESAHVGADSVLDSAIARLTDYLDGWHGDATRPLPAVVPARYRADGTVLSLFSTLAQFGTAEDIALAELKIELMFPADETTHNALIAMADSDQSRSQP